MAVAVAAALAVRAKFALADFAVRHKRGFRFVLIIAMKHILMAVQSVALAIGGQCNNLMSLCNLAKT
jgi:hypothetical protein